MIKANEIAYVQAGYTVGAIEVWVYENSTEIAIVSIPGSAPVSERIHAAMINMAAIQVRPRTYAVLTRFLTR